MTAADAFARLTGRDAQIVCSAPGRVNLIGEHTDYTGGLALPFAVQLRTSVAAARRQDDTVRVWSCQQDDGSQSFSLEDLTRGRPRGWAAYVAGAVWAARETGAPVAGMDLVVDSDVPVGAGLSSSAALCCAVTLASLGLAGSAASPREVAGLAHRAEADYVGMPCGVMDQLTAMLARAGHALLLDTSAGTHEHIPFEPGAQDLAVLVIDSGVRHALADSQYADRRLATVEITTRLGVGSLREVTVSSLPQQLAAVGDDDLGRRLRHIVTENARVETVAGLLRNSRLADVGPLLIASHQSLRDDYEVSIPELDVIVDAVLGGGALGARMIGGGFGGSAIALVRTVDVESVSRSVHEACSAARQPRPGIRAVTPSGGALTAR